MANIKLLNLKKKRIIIIYQMPRVVVIKQNTIINDTTLNTMIVHNFTLPYERINIFVCTENKYFIYIDLNELVFDTY